MKLNAQSFLLVIGLFFVANTFSQTDYKTGTKNKDGFTSIYYTSYTPAANYYTTSTSVTRYGLLDEKSKKIILPMKYSMVYTSYEDGMYIVQDTLEKTGLFSAKSGKFLIEPRYNKIEAFSEGLTIVQKKTGSGYNYEYYYGAVDKNGKLIIPDTFSYLGNCRDGLMNFKQDGKYGFIDKQNKIVIPAIYENFSTFSSGLAPARLDDRALYGYINKENKFVIQPKYVDAGIFYEGYADVYTEKAGYASRGGSYGADKAGLIDAKGNEVIPPLYKYISLRKEGGVFVVTKDDKSGMVDSTGKILLPADNKKIDEFYNGVARVEQTSGMYGLVNTKGKWLLPAENNEVFSLYSNGGYYVKKDGKYTVYDKNVKVIISADAAKRVTISKKNIAYVFDNFVKLYDVNGKYLKTISVANVDLYGTNFFSNDDSLKVPYFKGVSAYNLQTKTPQKLDVSEISDFNEEGIFAGKSGSKWTFYDFTGKKLYDKSFENVINFSEGICGLQESTYSKPYLADKSLNKVAELTTVFYGPYSEGLALSKNQYGGSVSYLNKQGKEQFFAYATDGGACKNGRVKLKSSEGKYFVVNRSGKTINNNFYDDLGDFSDGLAGFMNDKKGGYIDTSGNISIAAQFDEVSNFTNGVAMVKSGNEFFQIDKKGKPVTNAKYTGASDPANGTFPVKKGSNFGLIDTKGNIIIDFKYENITSMTEGMIWAQKGGKWSLLNSTGTELTPFEYVGAYAFEDGYAKVSKGKAWGVMDKTGKLVLPAEYEGLSKVYKNTILVVKPGGTDSYSVK